MAICSAALVAAAAAAVSVNCSSILLVCLFELGQEFAQPTWGSGVWRLVLADSTVADAS